MKRVYWTTPDGMFGSTALLADDEADMIAAALREHPLNRVWTDDGTDQVVVPGGCV